MTDERLRPVTTHDCASCGATIDSERKWDGHTDTCMQPEIRFRRMEQSIANAHGALLEAAEELRRLRWDTTQNQRTIHALALHILRPGDCLAPDGDHGDYCGGSDLCANCSVGHVFHGDCGIAKELVELLNESVRERGSEKPKQLADRIGNLDTRLRELETFLRPAMVTHQGAG